MTPTSPERVSVDSHPFVEHFRFVKALEDENTVAKLTIPHPLSFWSRWSCPLQWKIRERDHPNIEKLVEDLAAGYRKVIDDVYAAGCRNLQFDDCSWGMLVDPRACARSLIPTRRGWRPSRSRCSPPTIWPLKEAGGILVINTHVCRGQLPLYLRLWRL